MSLRTVSDVCETMRSPTSAYLLILDASPLLQTVRLLQHLVLPEALEYLVHFVNPSELVACLTSCSSAWEGDAAVRSVVSPTLWEYHWQIVATSMLVLHAL